MKIEEALLRKMWPHGDSHIPGLVRGIANSSEAVFRKYRITTPLQAAHIMAQFSLECGGGTEVEENLSYSAGRMTQVWPSRFPSIASALPYQHNPRKLANKVYNGRMGNRVGTDDGYNYRGRGGSQTTGREAYGKLGAAAGVDLINNPDLLLDPNRFFDFAVADFVMCGCLPFCAPKPGLPLGDINAVTHHLNGGYTGLADRKAWFARWWPALRNMSTETATAAPVAFCPPIVSSTSAVGSIEMRTGEIAAAAQDDDPAPETAPDAPLMSGGDVADYSEDATGADGGVLRYGQDNPDFEVRALQEKLVSLNYKVGRIDGDFSSGTRAAVLAFQADNGLPTDGEVDAATKAALSRAPCKPIAEARTDATADDLRAAGSETVKTADKIGWLGKAAAMLGLGGGADQSGALDSIKDKVDQVSGLRGVVDSLSDLGGWMLQHWWIGAAGAGFAAWYFGRKIIARRLADHRSGANMSF